MSEGVLTSWRDAILLGWNEVVSRIVKWAPNFLGALLIVVIGWLVAVGLELLVDRALRIVGLQALSEKAKIENALKKGGFEKDLSAIIAAFFKWIVMIAVFLAAAQVLQLTAIVEFFQNVLAYMPKAVAGAGILLAGVIGAHFLAQVVKGAVEAADWGYGSVISAVVYWSIVVFAFLTALSQLGVATVMIQTLFTGFVALIAIAGGLAFGLGGQRAAADFINKIRKEVFKK